MPEVTIAVITDDLRPCHAEAVIYSAADGLTGLLIKTRPATTGIKLGRRLKQFLTATDTDVLALLIMIIVLAGKRPFSALFPTHPITFLIELLLPLLCCFFHLILCLVIGLLPNRVIDKN
jgi:hypothetical protein